MVGGCERDLKTLKVKMLRKNAMNRTEWASEFREVKVLRRT